MTAFISAVCSIAVISLSNVVFYAVRNRGAGCTVGRLCKPFFSILSYTAWKRLHVVFQLAFCASTLSSGAIEIAFFAAGKGDSYLPVVPLVDHFVALPTLAIASASGLALTYKRYFQLAKPAHPCVEQIMRLLNAFGLFWLIVDKSSQFGFSGRNALFRTRFLAFVGSAVMSYYMRSIMLSLSKSLKVYKKDI